MQPIMHWLFQATGVLLFTSFFLLALMCVVGILCCGYEAVKGIFR